MYNVAVVGATGNVGRKFLEILEERNFPIKELFLFTKTPPLYVRNAVPSLYYKKNRKATKKTLL